LSFTVQIFHRGSGFFLNTGHKSDDLNAIKRLVDSDAFASVRLQVVDESGAIRYGPVARPRESSLSIADLASIMGVPVLNSIELPAVDAAGQSGPEVGYSLEAVHLQPLESIVSLELSQEEGETIIERLWPDEDLWSAPGGCSFIIESQREADVINEVLGRRFITFNPGRHRWCFHIYLVE
jgi:hypothetical protein